VANPRPPLLKTTRLDFSFVASYLPVPSIFELHDKRLVSLVSHLILYIIALLRHMPILSSVT
jgi:hypothetical protein